MLGDAIMDGEHRYRLDRHANGVELGDRLLWVMLNPSTANATEDDPTIRRVQRFTFDHRYRSFTVVNLHSLCATDPNDLFARVADSNEPTENDAHILRAAREASRIVVAWGAGARRYPLRVAWVVNLLLSTDRGIGGGLFPRDLWCLGTTAAGHPRHPLYVAASQSLRLWPWSEVLRG